MEQKQQEKKQQSHVVSSLGGIFHKIWNFLNRIFSLKTLLIIGIILYLNASGAFNDYPAIQQTIGIFCSFANWIFHWFVTLIEWICKIIPILNGVFHA